MYIYAVANEQEVNEIVVGRPAGHQTPWTGRRSVHRLPNGAVGAFWRDQKPDGGPIRPLILVVPEEEHRRLFGRFAQLRGDLSPLSAWCHLLTPKQFGNLDETTRAAELNGYEAAWTGLVVAEASLVAQRPVSKLKLAACLATQTYAVARTNGLWGSLPLRDILERYDAAHQLFRVGEPSTVRVRASLEAVWDALSAASSADALGTNASLRAVVRALRTLRESRKEKDVDEAEALYGALNELSEADLLLRLTRISPEMRVKEFDKLVAVLEHEISHERSARWHSLVFLTAYLATVAAGGQPSLRLAEDVSARIPELAAWAYLIGGVGERVVWTSSFDGLGRLVARELTRPLHFDEAPTCDFGLEEALTLVDRQLSDSLVYLKIKQLRVVSVSLLPGVNISISYTEGMREAAPEPIESAPRLSNPPRLDRNVLSSLADALFPYFEARLDHTRNRYGGRKQQKSGTARRAPSLHPKLPIEGSEGD
jgi:hypothetical protein